MSRRTAEALLQTSADGGRPSEPLARGRYEAPAWAIGALGAAVVAAGVGYFVWRARRARKAAR